ncbi:unnamed protein product [Sphagnum troendelagicum]
MFLGKEEPVYHISPSQYTPADSRRNPKVYPGNGALPVLLLKVPMCCDKCEEKVREELNELPGVQTIVCDQSNQKVTVTGHVDPILALKQVTRYEAPPQEYELHAKVREYEAPWKEYEHRDHETPRKEYERRDHEALWKEYYSPSRQEYVRRDDRRYDSRDPYQDSQRDYYGVRHMPSCKKHRNHDAEYISMDDHITLRGTSIWVSPISTPWLPDTGFVFKTACGKSLLLETY